MNNRFVLILFSLLLIVLIFSCTGENTTSLKKEETVSQNTKNGKKLFKKYCAQCHSNNMIDEMTGPALGPAFNTRNQEWLKNYVKNPNKMLDSGDSIAIKYREEGWGLMPTFNYLKESEIDDIFEYIRYQYNTNK